MIKIGSFEAKTNFSKIIKRVKQGEEFLITNRGKVVAKISSCHDENPDNSAFLKKMKEIRKNVSVSMEEIIMMKNEGKR